MSWIVFDVDGVLIDTSKSFDLTIKLTAEHFLKRFDKFSEVELRLIRKLRVKGSFGDDFKITEALINFYLGGNAEELVNEFKVGEGIEAIRRDFGENLDNNFLIRVFNTFYLGEEYKKRIFNFDGLWKMEKRIIDVDLLEELRKYFKIGVITGRDKREMALAEKIIGMSCENKITREDGEKPDPSLLYLLVKEESGIYIGDTVNDKIFVLNYNEKYHKNFGFYMVNRSMNVNSIIKNILLRFRKPHTNARHK